MLLPLQQDNQCSVLTQNCGTVVTVAVLSTGGSTCKLSKPLVGKAMEMTRTLAQGTSELTNGQVFGFGAFGIYSVLQWGRFSYNQIVFKMKMSRV